MERIPRLVEGTLSGGHERAKLVHVYWSADNRHLRLAVYFGASSRRNNRNYGVIQMNFWIWVLVLVGIGYILGVKAPGLAMRIGIA